MVPGSTTLHGLALDARSLDALRRDASSDPKAAVQQAAGQFEALFMQQLLKSMRDAMPKSGMFDGPGHDTYVGMLDQQLATSLANRPGGLAAIIAKQLERNLSRDPGSVEASPAQPASAARGAVPLAPHGSPVPGAAGEAPEVRHHTPQLGFVQRMWPHAVAAQRATGVRAAFVVGQAALESGWGRHEIRHPDGRSAHNLFGIKATGGWDGKVAAVTTTEYVDGAPRKVVAKFRAYDSYEESFRDYARLITENPRYEKALAKVNSVQGWAAELQRAGYATDPDYASKLSRAIRSTMAVAGTSTGTQA